MIRKVQRMVIVTVMALALAPVATLAQMGSPMRRMRVMNLAAMEHSDFSPPFYREQTFLVLIGFALAGAGLVAFRVARSRWRWWCRPVEFVNEAVLVVDLVESTQIATHYGNGLAMYARNFLKERTLAAAQTHGFCFAENTGDGYFMTFPSVVSAVKTAMALLKDLKDRPPDLSSGSPVEVRAGISYGEILFDTQAVRHGAFINKAFRLTGLSRESFVPVEGGSELNEIPDRNRILLDEEAAQELRFAKISIRSLGYCRLKGFPGLHRVFEVGWDRPFAMLPGVEVDEAARKETNHDR